MSVGSRFMLNFILVYSMFLLACVLLSRRCGLEVTSPLRKRNIHGSNRGRGIFKNQQKVYSK